ncbi:hypothetical protein DFP72DRAFT_529209 [Ephemerocybe angulata]|uniref:Uncharacterized protein n=1 Tax=Ephemerocybe angulata TaxID=980116 RepID=A0A8H6IFB1_9AGAR|nr:hypothetical protein DFP72DRAFT_529209 [Tulosesus angulatus]
MEQEPPVHLLGSPGFFPALINHIKSLSNFPSLPLDQVTVQSVLLCLIAGEKHLILRTPEEDIGLAVKLVAWTLTYVFNYSTHKVKIRSRSSTSGRGFLESLFLPKAGGPGRLSRTGTKAVLTPRYPRSVSYPNDLSQAPTQVAEQPLGLDPDSPNTISPRLHHSVTEPAPIRLKTDASDLPRALILSGVEKGSSDFQQELSDVISERRVSTGGYGGGVSNFPPGFIAIYICSINDTERPSIHKSLLDKFSISHNIFISQPIRLALQALPFSPMNSFSQTPSFSYSNPGSPTVSYQVPLPQAQTPPYFAKPLPAPQPNRHQSSSGAPPFTREPISQLFIDTLRRHCRATHFTPELGMYLSDLFAAARHHPRLDGMLLTAKARKDAEDLARAARVIGSDLTGMELIRPVDKDDNESEYFDAQSDTRYLRTIDESSTTNLLRKDSFSKISSMGLDDDAMDVEEVLVFDVTEVDVARTMPRVVTHRLRLRDGPEDEVLASAVIGATFGGSFATKTAPRSFERTETGVQQSLQKGYEGLTVKDVLVDILNKV